MFPGPFSSRIRIVKFLVLPSPRNSRIYQLRSEDGFSGGSDNIGTLMLPFFLFTTLIRV